MQKNNNNIKNATIMLLIVVICLLATLNMVNVKSIIMLGFNGIIFFKVIAIILFATVVILDLISCFLYVSDISSNEEKTKCFKAGNILFLISLCILVVLQILVQCA